MEIAFRNTGEYADVKLRHNGGVLDFGLLSVDEATELHAEIHAAADRLGIWLKGHGVNLHVGEYQ